MRPKKGTYQTLSVRERLTQVDDMEESSPVASESKLFKLTSALHLTKTSRSRNFRLRL
jgi:hypothetical protein